MKKSFEGDGPDRLAREYMKLHGARKKRMRVAKEEIER